MTVIKVTSLLGASVSSCIQQSGVRKEHSLSQVALRLRELGGNGGTWQCYPALSAFRPSPTITTATRRIEDKEFWTQEWIFVNAVTNSAFNLRQVYFWIVVTHCVSNNLCLSVPRSSFIFSLHQVAGARRTLEEEGDLIPGSGVYLLLAGNLRSEHRRTIQCQIP